MKKTIEHFGVLDVVVNNAGYGFDGALEELTADEISENFGVNFIAVVSLVQQVLPYLQIFNICQEIQNLSACW